MELKTTVPRYRVIPGEKASNVIHDHDEPRDVKVTFNRGILHVPMEELDYKGHGEFEIFPFKMKVSGVPEVERGQDNSGGWWSMVTVHGTKKTYNEHRGYTHPEYVQFKQWDHSPDEVWIDIWYSNKPFPRAKERCRMSTVVAKGARLDEIGDIIGVKVVTPNTPDKQKMVADRVETLMEKRKDELAPPLAPVNAAPPRNHPAAAPPALMGRML